MHPNFYHWHARAELKPETAKLEARWNAAVKCTEKPSSADICSLLKLVLFPGAEPDFAKRFGEALVKAEPTFPPNNNGELLRIMATAGVYSQMETSSKAANAFALGLQAASFPPSRVEPICQEVMTRCAEYLAAESEKVRPKIYITTLARAEKQAETVLGNLKKAAESNSPQEVGKAAEALGRGVLTAIKESHQQLGDVIVRLTEESQFLWWLIGRRSPSLDVRREQLSANAYALPAATEAAERVAVLPPAASVESILGETLLQCGKKCAASMTLVEVFTIVGAVWVKSSISGPTANGLTPMANILATIDQSGKPDADLIKKLDFPAKMKISALEASCQFFRERVFLRALEETR
jgi:hypothetical protein